LLHRAHPVERTVLAFTLWPDESEANAHTNLRRHVYLLRGILPPTQAGVPWLLSDTATIQWNPAADYWLDVAEFERLSDSRDTMAEAVALYKGELLESVYDDWLFYERERLRHLYFADLTQLIVQSRALRDYPVAIEYARQLLNRDPLREDTARELMTLRYEAGDRGGALQEYERFGRHLREELAVDPMPETAALYEAIVDNARLPGGVPEADTTPSGDGERPRRNLLPFVGREAEMEQLSARWALAARGRGGVVMLGGEAGIGKTRLAAELSRQAEKEGARVLSGSTTFAEPMPYQATVQALDSALPLLAAMDIGPVWLAAVSVLLPRFALRRGRVAGSDAAPSGAKALSPHLDPERERTRLFEAIARCLEGLAQPRPVLLVLEDLHWAGAATAALLEFLARRAANHSLLILVTYREEETSRSHPLRDLRRRLQRESQVYHLALTRLAPEAVETLVSRLPELAAQLPPAELARELHAESEGNPFFLGELIRDLLDQPGIRNQGHERQRGAIRPDRQTLIPNPRSPIPGRRPSSIITGRIDRLSPQARSLVEIAAVVGPAFDLELVREVSGWDEHQVLDSLDELLDRGLVREAGGPGAQRRHSDYIFTHHLIQSTIYRGVPAATRKRRHRRAAQVIEEIYPERLDEISGELATHHDRGGEHDLAARYYLRAAQRALAVFANDEALKYIAPALDAAIDPSVRFDLLALRETVSSRRGDHEAQRNDLRQLEELAGSLNDEDLACEVLRRRILLARGLGERQVEAEMVARLSERAAASGRLRWQAEALQAEAASQLLLGQYDTARIAAERAIALRRTLGDTSGQAECYSLLAEGAVHQGRFTEAQKILSHATSIAGPGTNQSLLVGILRAASSAAITEVDISTSYALGRQMLELCRRIGDREGEADAHARLAAADVRLFHIEEAREHYKQAQTLYAILGNRRGQAAVLVNQGMLSSNLGHHTEAVGASLQAESLFGSLNDVRGQTVCAVNIALYAMRDGDHARARAAGMRGLRLARMMKSQVMQAYALSNIGAAEREMGRLGPAIKHMEAGLALRRALGQQPVELATDLCDLTIAYLRAGNLPSAERITGEMLGILAADPDHMTYPQYILWAAAQTYRDLGRPARARELLGEAHKVLLDKVSAIPDPESQASFLELPHNRELLAAHQLPDWP
jgi:predicted ATPase/DNA-binding SARP family transcriptional activator